MTLLTNRQTYYNVSNQTESLQLSGSATFTEDQRINTFYGQVLTTNNLCVGNFSYMEYPNGRSSKTLNEAYTEQIIEISQLINNTIADLKEQIRQFQDHSEKEIKEES